MNKIPNRYVKIWRQGNKLISQVVQESYMDYGGLSTTNKVVRFSR
jgi:hypothetical protein